MVMPRRFKKRQSRCYELSAIIQLDSPVWILVHGILHADGLPKKPYPHAWLECGSVVYDVVLDKHFLKNEFCYEFQAEELARYPNKEAAERLLSTGHYVPWEDNPGRYQ